MEPVALSSVQCLFQFEIHCLPDFTLICKCHLRRSGENNLKWCKNKIWKKPPKNKQGRVLQAHSKNTSFGCFVLIRIAELCTVNMGWNTVITEGIYCHWNSTEDLSIYLSELSSTVSVISIISLRLNNQKKYNQNLKACMNACMCIYTVSVFVYLYKCRFYIQQMCRFVRLSPYFVFFSPQHVGFVQQTVSFVNLRLLALRVYWNDTRCVSHHKRTQKSWMSRLYSPVPGRGVTFHY